MASQQGLKCPSLHMASGLVPVPGDLLAPSLGARRWEFCRTSSLVLLPCDSHALPSEGRMPAPRVGTTGPGEVLRKCVGLGLGWEPGGGLLEQALRWAQRAHCCWAQPGQALESFEKCLDGGSPRSWPGLPLGGAVSQGTGGEAGILSSETRMEEAGVRAGLPHGKNKQAQFTHCWQGGRCWPWSPTWDLKKGPGPGSQKALGSNPGSVAV